MWVLLLALPGLGAACGSSPDSETTQEAPPPGNVELVPQESSDDLEFTNSGRTVSGVFERLTPAGTETLVLTAEGGFLRKSPDGHVVTGVYVIDSESHMRFFLEWADGAPVGFARYERLALTASTANDLSLTGPGGEVRSYSRIADEPRSGPDRPVID